MNPLSAPPAVLFVVSGLLQYEEIEYSVRSNHLSQANCHIAACITPSGCFSSEQNQDNARKFEKAVAASPAGLFTTKAADLDALEGIVISFFRKFSARRLIMAVNAHGDEENGELLLFCPEKHRCRSKCFHSAKEILQVLEHAEKRTGNYFDIIGLGSCVSNVFAAAMRRAAPPSLANTAYVGLAFLHPEDGYVCDRDGSVSTDLNKETKRKEKEKQRREKETRERAREKKKYKNRELQAFLRAVLTEGRLVSINDKRARCWYIPSKDARTICIVQSYCDCAKLCHHAKLQFEVVKSSRITFI